jgi:hypothetical protein
VTGILGLIRAERAAHAAVLGKRALLAAETDLEAHNIPATRQDLARASSAFAQVHREIGALGPLRVVAEYTPLLRVQLHGAQTYADAGVLLTNGATSVTNAAAQVVNPPDRHIPLSDALQSLRQIRSALEQGINDIDDANGLVMRLNGKRLLGPLDSARRQLARELPVVQRRAVSADQGLAALIDFAGGNGPRRYLVLSQNPDEPRPTGGYIGTYGVISAASGHISLERYASIESWYGSHPATDVPADQAPTAFRIPDPPVHQTLANVNATADWPTGAELARKMWLEGGEQQADGVAAITPEFLSKILGVLGPVAVPGYPGTVTASNVVDRVDFYTHVDVAPGSTDRKEFIVELARVAMQELLGAPASSWDPLGRVVATAFNRHEIMAFSSEPAVEQTLSARGWDGRLPAVSGDFFYDGEFAYASKNGRGLHRTFHHVVHLAPDGSGTVTTTATIADTEPPSMTGSFNINSLSYLTFYGPSGAHLVSSSLAPDASEPPLSGHPALGWDLAAPPLGQTSVTFTWFVPHLATREADGSWRYQLWWMHLPDHVGDSLYLTVVTPPGWRWDGPAPPSTASLDQDLVGSWQLQQVGH